MKKKVRSLFRIRQKMIENMKQSGIHSSDPWLFVEAAMNHVKKETTCCGITKSAAFYFYVRCEEHGDLDSKFQPFLDRQILGDSELLCVDSDSTHSDITDEVGSEKRRAASVMTTSHNDGYDLPVYPDTDDCPDDNDAGATKNTGTVDGVSLPAAKKRATSTALVTPIGPKRKKPVEKKNHVVDVSGIAGLLKEGQCFLELIVGEAKRFNKMHQSQYKDTQQQEREKNVHTQQMEKLKFELEIAKAMGNQEKIVQIMEAVRKL
jgi:hypothetical protein